MSEVVGIHDLSSYMDRSEFLRWKSFRESEDSRYIGLVLPRFLLRMPYGSESNPTREFNYEEGVRREGSENYLTDSLAAAWARSRASSAVLSAWR